MKYLSIGSDLDVDHEKGHNYMVICSRHFVGGEKPGPTELNPYPTLFPCNDSLIDTDIHTFKVSV